MFVRIDEPILTHNYHPESIVHITVTLSVVHSTSLDIYIPTLTHHYNSIRQSSFTALKILCGASLVAQWLIVCLPMQGTRVRALVWEDPTCRGAAGPVSHDY